MGSPTALIKTAPIESGTEYRNLVLNDFSHVRAKKIASPNESLVSVPLSLENEGEVSTTTPKYAIQPVEDFDSREIGRFEIKQKWEGYVTAVAVETFSAVIKDKTNESFPDEEVELCIDDVPMGDRGLIEPGAVFYWYIGYSDRPGAPRDRTSRILFRRVANWTVEELQRAKEKAKSLADFLSAD